MAGSAERKRQFTGPALFSHGFRPFFLLAALWAAGAMLLWIAMMLGRHPLPVSFDPFSWHAHEFLFGYLGAVVAGFVLTAVPNWTGGLPVMGWPLAGLVGLWLAGRVAVAISGMLPWAVTALADLSLVLALIIFISGEILRGRNWRNLPVLGLIALYGFGNAGFHLQEHLEPPAHDGWAMRLGLAAALMLITLIGGRIIPGFTRNWLVARQAARLPRPFGWADAAIFALTGLTLAGFVSWPEAAPTHWLMLLTGALHLWRVLRWRGWQVRSEPLLWVLHTAYGFLALGFLAEGAAGFGFPPAPNARHLWLVGAIGLMTLGVMCRATLGHTGRPLHAGPATLLIYAALMFSALARLAVPFTGNPGGLLHLAGGLWIFAFGGYAAVYGPMLLRPRHHQALARASTGK
ncbi:NnrS family protein [Paracoccus sp. MBLB3053]|uniref:NnrS family protein n=1 Tax=Paracoccus aurantius TaxID=3073814 RepID=A0ABU2HUM5_9RHOB|nr:NnrS family protein [Paracoccus sp. MBLB3053]MDS9468748.1 NnrS family protein [Paracoccus sp. MBLB3053]